MEKGQEIKYMGLTIKFEGDGYYVPALGKQFPSLRAAKAEIKRLRNLP
jgi:hypothetical protein